MDNTAFDVYPDKGDKGIGFQVKYVQSIPGLIKLIEIMLLLFSFAMAVSFKNSVSIFRLYGTGSIDFHLAVAIVAWLGAIAFFIGYALNLVVVIKEKFSPLIIVLTIIHGVGAGFVFVSSVVLLNDCVTTRNSPLNLCDTLSSYTSTNCSVIEASGAFGFFAFIAILADAALHMLQFVKERRAAQEAQGEGASHEGKKNDAMERETELPNPYAE